LNEEYLTSTSSEEENRKIVEQFVEFLKSGLMKKEGSI